MTAELAHRFWKPICVYIYIYIWYNHCILFQNSRTGVTKYLPWKGDLGLTRLRTIIWEYWPAPGYFLVDLMILEQTTTLSLLCCLRFLLLSSHPGAAPLLCWSHTSIALREASVWQHHLCPGTIPWVPLLPRGSLPPLPSPSATSCLFCPHSNSLLTSSLFWTVHPGEILGYAISPDGPLNVLFSSWRCILFSWNNLCQFSLEIWKTVSPAELFCLCRGSAVINKGFYSWRFFLLLFSLSWLLIPQAASLLLGVVGNLWEHTQLY